MLRAGNLNLVFAEMHLSLGPPLELHAAGLFPLAQDQAVAAVPRSIAIPANSDRHGDRGHPEKRHNGRSSDPTIAFFLPLLHSGPWLCRKSFTLAGLTTNRETLSSSVRLSQEANMLVM